MVDRRARWAWAAILVATLTTVGAALAQGPGDTTKTDSKKTDTKKAASPAAKVPNRKGKKGGLLLGGGNPPKDTKAKAKEKGLFNPNLPPRWPYYVKFTIQHAKNAQTIVPITARYYPPRASAAPNAPVLLLVHQSGTGHSGRDFEETIDNLKGLSLAEHYQALDYGVLVIDRRGHGGPEAKQQVVSRDPSTLCDDLRAAYAFLVDRHNHRELNLAKLGIIAVGDGANLVAYWIAAEDGTVSSPGRLADIGGLVIVSPQLEAQNTNLKTVLAPLGPRLSIFLVAGNRDVDAYNAARPLVERNRASKGILFESRLPGDRLLKFEPKIIPLIDKYLEEPVKFRTNTEWEPRYLLQPVEYKNVEVVPGKPIPEPGAAKKEAEKPKAEPAEPKDEEKAKPEAEKK